MAASTNSRKPEKAAKQGSPRNQGETVTSDAAIPSSALLSLRLWNGSDPAHQAVSVWETDAPAVCLALDLISASQGLPVARDGEVLVAAFPSFQSAILAARRLQWAAQGFAEGAEPHSGPLAALIHAPKEDPGQSVGEAVHLLQQAAPEQILLSSQASRFFDNLPGFPLQAASGDGLRELVWRAPQSQSSRASDEEVLAQLVAEQAAQNQPEPEPARQAPIQEDFSAAAVTRNTGRFQAEEPQKSSRKLIGGLAAAAVVVAAAAIFYFTHGSSTPAPDQSQTQSAPASNATGTAPTAPESQTASTSSAASTASTHPKPAEAEPLASKSAKNAQKGANKPNQQASSDTPTPREEKVAPAKSQPEAQRGGRCDLDPSQYAGQIDQAWKKLGRGKYADAQREFAAVLACDSGNGRAKEGLERARMAAREADGGSEN
jgi:hypothetical protein